MADFAFYTQVYLGSEVPEKAFDSAAAQAKAVLSRFRRIYRVKPCTQVEENMAICAMAETLYAFNKCKAGLSAATVGSVSVRYDHGEGTDKSLSQQLYRINRIAIRLFISFRQNILVQFFVPFFDVSIRYFLSNLSA